MYAMITLVTSFTLPIGTTSNTLVGDLQEETADDVQPR
jgi:hypothetical protein